MAVSLKVYGVRGYCRGGQLHVVVAATSWKEAAALAGISVHEARTYGSTTANPRDIAAALAQPRVALARPLDNYRAAFVPLDTLR